MTTVGITTKIIIIGAKITTQVEYLGGTFYYGSKIYTMVVTCNADYHLLYRCNAYRRIVKTCVLNIVSTYILKNVSLRLNRIFFPFN